MIALGITGGIGAGKSTTADFLAEQESRCWIPTGWPVNWLNPDNRQFAEIVEAFGPAVLNPAGGLG
jgi:dephospho-CoA kinase